MTHCENCGEIIQGKAYPRTENVLTTHGNQLGSFCRRILVCAACAPIIDRKHAINDTLIWVFFLGPCTLLLLAFVSFFLWPDETIKPIRAVAALF